MKRKIISSILIIVFLFSLMPVSSFLAANRSHLGNKKYLESSTGSTNGDTQINKVMTVYQADFPDIRVESDSLYFTRYASAAVPVTNNPPDNSFPLNSYVSIKNPASEYCAGLGYDSGLVTAEDGSQHSICKLTDDVVCDGWDFYAGKCGHAYSYCALQGLDTVTLEDGQNQFSSEYAVCVDELGNILGSASEMMNLYDQVSGDPGIFNRYVGPPEPPMDYAVEALPLAFDWRDHLGSDWTTPVKDQARCGSCWAFSAVGASEAALNIASNSPDLDLDLSEQYLVTDCALDEGSCAGGWNGDALEFIRYSGIPDEACFPYLEMDCTSPYLGYCSTSTCTYNSGGECSDYQCSDRCWDWVNRLHTIDSFTYMGNYPNIDTIKTALIDHGPLSVSMNMGGTFSDGIYTCSDNTSINHGVVIVGYDDAGSYWIVKNSWGDIWDGDGFFHVAYDNCAIQKYPYYADASAVSGITIFNDGSADLQIDSISIVGSSCWLSISPLRIPPFTIAPGGSETVGVTVDLNCVNVGTYNDTIRIDSSDPDEDPFDVPVTLEFRPHPLPDLVVSQPQPSISPPFYVGDNVNWSVTVTNQGDADAVATHVGFYLGTSCQDFSNLINIDSVVSLPSSESDTQSITNTLQLGDVGTWYQIVYADYQNEEPEESNEDNNTNCYGPFEVRPDAGITVNLISGLVTTESGGTDTFTVVLDRQPSANVTIGLSSSDTSEGIVLPSSLTFTTANWDSPQTAIVTGADDAIADGDVPYSIITAPATSGDPKYHGINPSDVSVTNLNNDLPGITVDPNSGLVTTESGDKDTFIVVLNSQPSTNVSIGLGSSDTSEGTVSPSSLTFTSSNWDSEQTVTVTGVDDAVDDGNRTYTIFTTPASSYDPHYSGLNPADILVINNDDDEALTNIYLPNVMGNYEYLPSIIRGSEWPMYAHDPSRTAWNSTEKVLYPPLKPEWSQSIDNYYVDGISVANGMIFLSGMDKIDKTNKVHALNISGEPRWSYKLSGGGRGAMSSPPTYYNNTVFFGGQHDDNLYATDYQYGYTLWTLPGVNGLYASPLAVVDNLVYAFGEQSKLFAVKGDEGRVVWSHSADGWGGRTAIWNDVIVALSWNTPPIGFNRITGQMLWQRNDIQTYFSDIVAYDDRVYLGSNTNIIALDLYDGTTIWETPLPNNPQLTSIEDYGFAFADNVIIAAGGVRAKESSPQSQKIMLAIEAKTGRIIWKTEVCSVWAQPVIANDVVYAVRRKEYMGNTEFVALNFEDGMEIWSWEDPESSYFYPEYVVADIYLYLGYYLDDGTSVIVAFKNEQ